MTDEQRAREFDFECTQVDDHDYEDCRKCAGMRQRLVALLASRALEARNEALEEAAKLVDKFTNPLKVAEKLSWLESPMTFARVMEVISAEIRSLAAASKAAGGGQ